MLAGLVTTFVLALAFLALRRRMLQRGDGAVSCALRLLATDQADGTWVNGIARYEGDQLIWHRAFGLTLRPTHVISRRELVVTGQRRPDEREVLELPGEWDVIGCRVGRRHYHFELAMSESTMTGFLAWLESSPPGTHVDHIT